MTKQVVFDTLEAAKESPLHQGKFRVYEVTRAADGATVYVVALSPRTALGEAATELGLSAKLAERRHVAAERVATLQQFAANLPAPRRRELIGLLDGMFGR